ncbi:MAG: DUF4359 domain-containing protein [Nostocaceae cyanobacterium]|nr:DUF4359 domain-containing protein [Nostocaceae cyanobacterium]
MKPSNIITCMAVTGLVVLGAVMAKTNPSQAEYEEYAAQELTGYFKKNVCNQTPNILANLIKVNCERLVDEANPQMRQILKATTQRQDFLFLSIYRTDFKLNPWIPGYKFETVGAFDKFYTYKLEKK